MNDTFPQGPEQVCLTCTLAEEDALRDHRILHAMTFVLSAHPHTLPLQELVHELTNNSWDEEADVKRLVDDLITIRLIDCRNDLLFPSGAAIAFGRVMGLYIGE